MDRIAIYIVTLSAGSKSGGEADCRWYLLGLIAQRDGARCLFLLSPTSNSPVNND